MWLKLIYIKSFIIIIWFVININLSIKLNFIFLRHFILNIIMIWIVNSYWVSWCWFLLFPIANAPLYVWHIYNNRHIQTYMYYSSCEHSNNISITHRLPVEKHFSFILMRYTASAASCPILYTLAPILLYYCKFNGTNRNLTA